MNDSDKIICGTNKRKILSCYMKSCISFLLKLRSYSLSCACWGHFCTFVWEILNYFAFLGSSFTEFDLYTVISFFGTGKEKLFWLFRFNLVKVFLSFMETPKKSSHFKLQHKILPPHNVLRKLCKFPSKNPIFPTF